MPIDVECGCGKTFRVKDEHAGKRGKCPACGEMLTIPAPAAKPPTAEDEAFRLLSEGPDPPAAPPPPRREWTADPVPPPRPAPPPVPAAPSGRRAIPGFNKAMDDDRAERRRSRRSGISISPGVLGGLGLMAGAAIWFFVGLAGGVIFFYPPVLFIIGLVTLVRALFGHED